MIIKLVIKKLNIMMIKFLIIKKIVWTPNLIIQPVLLSKKQK